MLNLKFIHSDIQVKCYSSFKEGDEDEDNPQNVFNYNQHKYRERNNFG